MLDKEFLHMPVRNIMTKELITVEIGTSLEVVDRIFKENKIHHLPVMKGQEVVGMISQGDLLLLLDWGTRLGLKVSNKINRNLLRSNLVEDIMSSKLVTVPPDYTLGQCASIFKENLFHALPVVQLGRLVGLITSYDLLVVAYTPSHLIEQ